MFKHRRHRRNRYKRNTIIVISVSVLVLFISVGYAAFSTNIDLHIKGNIVKYTVTLDPNGGNLDNTSKVVTYHDTYGQLPTPTREGYTFKGWHEKNMLNINVQKSLPSDTSAANTTKRLLYLNTYVVGLAHDNTFYPERVDSYDYNLNSITVTSRAGYGIAYPIKLLAEEKYSISYEANSSNTMESSTLCAILFYKADGNFISNLLTFGTGSKKITFSSPVDSSYMAINFINNLSLSTTIFSNIQLEEGDTPTKYEPYYVTSDTTVVQKKDHTLTAIWEENTP